MKQLFENLGGTIAVALATISWADVEVGFEVLVCSFDSCRHYNPLFFT